VLDLKATSHRALTSSLLIALGLSMSACSPSPPEGAPGRGTEQSSPTLSTMGVDSVASPGVSSPPSSALPIRPGMTVVSITFDDGSASQYATSAMLQERGMLGTYYINTAMVGSSRYYMTWPQVHSLDGQGNEIGGHTLHHENLTKIDLATARTEVCDDRANLLNEGFAAASFAYPEAGADSSAIEQVVKDCGYSTGRGVGSLYGNDCPCPHAETIPPLDPFRLRTMDGVTSSTTLADLQAGVVGAEQHGGGWIPIAFHGICDDQCTRDTSLSTAIFTQFLDWLALRSRNGTVVRTIAQVMQPLPPPTRYR
jgi:peptidoglycan/xylan/chitin deacetylase (PgdA/CDA1 family)